MVRGILLLIYSVFYILPLSGQKTNDEAIYTEIIDTLDAMHNFGFYHEKLNYFDTKRYTENPFDTFEIIDPHTYETIYKLGIDFMIEFDSLNIIESKLYKKRLLYPNGFFKIRQIRTGGIRRQIDLKAHVDLENYPDINLLSEFSEDMFSDRSLDNHGILGINEINTDDYKYVVKAYIAFSGIQWDINERYCIVECGSHYRIRNSGTSGWGFLAVLEKTNNKIEIIKLIGLWEE